MNKRTQELLNQVARVNPYNRQNQNQERLFYIYQLGYIAGALADIIDNDPYWRKRFLDKVLPKQDR